jgi:hypothetical protein
MLSDTLESSFVREDFQVLLDGDLINIPDERRSLAAIRSYLETLALEKQRILFSFSVDGSPAGFDPARGRCTRFSRVEAQTFDLDEMPVRMINMAVQQVAHAERQVLSAISMVLINEGSMAREFWWDLTCDLKQPLLTLALMPDHVCGPAYGGASVSQLRRWQLEQLGAILRDVDEACRAKDSMVLAAALETRVMPWLENLRASLELLKGTLLSGLSAGMRF